MVHCSREKIPQARFTAGLCYRLGSVLGTGRGLVIDPRTLEVKVLVFPETRRGCHVTCSEPCDEGGRERSLEVV